MVLPPPPPSPPPFQTLTNLPPSPPAPNTPHPPQDYLPDCKHLKILHRSPDRSNNLDPPEHVLIHGQLLADVRESIANVGQGFCNILLEFLSQLLDLYLIFPNLTVRFSDGCDRFANAPLQTLPLPLRRV